MRPLYIDGLPGCRVVLDEPALRVVMPAQADQLFPLSRISRVVCKGVVDWSMPAMLACADAGIHLLFLQRNGELRARWLGRGTERQSLTQRLVDLLARSDGPGLYENWRLSMQKLAGRSFARRMGVQNWREASISELRQQLLLTLGTVGKERANCLHSLLQAEILLWLPDAGLGCDDEALLNDQLDLVQDFSDLLIWDFYPSLLTADATPQQAIMPAMARLLQQRSDRCYLLFRGSLNKLQQFLLAVS